ncbi:MAG: DUF3418 domain-containing protein, partial [Deltaproteobacteria bacterium]|nr:DUF3418 domain-containing protein [Deltaproteobacteria bacterium]
GACLISSSARLSGGTAQSAASLAPRNSAAAASSRLLASRTVALRNTRSDLIKHALSAEYQNVDESYYDRIHRCLLAGLPTTIGTRDEGRAYRGTASRRFYVFPGSGTFGHPLKWVMAFVLVETTKLYARLVAEIDPAWLEDIAPHLCRFQYRDIHYSPKEGFVYALKSVTLAGLEIQRDIKVHYGSVDPEDARRLFISDGMVKGAVTSRHPWLKRYRQLLQEVSELEARIRKPESLLDEKASAKRFDEILPPGVCSAHALDSWLDASKVDFSINLQEIVSDALLLQQAKGYPDTLVFNAHAFKLMYKYAPGELSDGISLICPSQLIWLLPQWAPDWLVPGWLNEKVQLFIRSLPKRLRVACNPARQRAEAFIDGVNSGLIDSRRPLLNALAEYLSEACQMAILPGDFDPRRLPAHLVMKIVEIDDAGDPIQTHTSVPDRQAYSSRLASTISAQQELSSEGSSEWPGSSLPIAMFLDSEQQLIAYPALADEQTHVCRRVFLDEQEALQSHRAGVVRLFRLQNPNLVQQLKKGLEISETARFALRSIEQARGWLTDLMDTIIWETLSDDERQAPRDPRAFQTRTALAREKLASVATAKASRLNTIMLSRSAILESCGKVRGCAESLRDIEGQLAFLFRKGFIKDNRIWSDYPRYLKALEIRVDRLSYSRVKDLEKLKSVEPFVERFNRRWLKTEHPERAVRLWDFAHMIEEYRIAVFAPELGTRQKVSPKRLERFWAEWVEKESRGSF